MKSFFITIWTAITNTFWKLVFKMKHRAGFLDLGKDIEVTGTILWTDYGLNPDGDFTFHLKLDPEYAWANQTFGGRHTSADPDYPDTLHCEIVPWDRNKFKDILPLIKPGIKVKVNGRWGYDGVHTGKPEWLEVLYAIWGHGPSLDGWLEIHGINSIEII